MAGMCITHEVDVKFNTEFCSENLKKESILEIQAYRPLKSNGNNVYHLL
jgi:hypothetical protein